MFRWASVIVAAAAFVAFLITEDVSYGVVFLAALLLLTLLLRSNSPKSTDGKLTLGIFLDIYVIVGVSFGLAAAGADFELHPDGIHPRTFRLVGAAMILAGIFLCRFAVLSFKSRRRSSLNHRNPLA
jgi:hypothetical protein